MIIILESDRSLPKVPLAHGRGVRGEAGRVFLFFILCIHHDSYRSVIC